jgi:hypothetical protein
MNIEYLGIFGLSWQEKVASNMYKIVSDKNKKKLKDFLQPGGWNTGIVNTLYSHYILQNVNITAKQLSAVSGMDQEITEAFLVSLSDLSIRGTIPYKIYNPWKNAEIEEIKTELLEPAPITALKKYGTIAAFLVGGIIVTNLLTSIQKTVRR